MMSAFGGIVHPPVPAPGETMQDVFPEQHGIAPRHGGGYRRIPFRRR
jgi:hypothetical protein